jgi:hypothetical protein
MKIQFKTQIRAKVRVTKQGRVWFHKTAWYRKMFRKGEIVHAELAGDDQKVDVRLIGEDNSIVGVIFNMNKRILKEVI